MIGYALEVQLIRWSCKCKSHPNGMCESVESHKNEKLREAYLGSFFYPLKTLADVLRKWDSWLMQAVKQ